jgi:hypothetical protein
MHSLAKAQMWPAELFFFFAIAAHVRGVLGVNFVSGGKLSHRLQQRHNTSRRQIHDLHSAKWGTMTRVWIEDRENAKAFLTSESGAFEEIW